jgi:hypothetical protein
MDAFNATDTSKYIDWCYQLLIRFSNDPDKNKALRTMMKTRLIICSTHYLKNLIKDIKKIEKKNKDLCHVSF